jgi:hypothetical protein
MKEFVFAKQGERLVLVGRCKADYDEWLRTLEDGEHYRATFRAISGTKTRKQLGYYYASLVPDVIDGLTDLGWTDVGFVWIAGTKIPLMLTSDNVDMYLKQTYASSLNLTEVSKARMSRQEMQKFIDYILLWAHENGIPIHPPRYPKDE